MSESAPPPSRRELFSSVNPLRPRGSRESSSGENAGLVQRTQLDAGSTIRLATRAMACDFSVIMNPGPTEQITAAGQALDLVHATEAWLSLYRDSSELSAVNRLATDGSVPIRNELTRLLTMAFEVHARTDGAFDMASGTLTRLWRKCRREQRIPEQPEINIALACAGQRFVELDFGEHRFSEHCIGERGALVPCSSPSSVHFEPSTSPANSSVRFKQPAVILDPGAIGKGFALDESCDLLMSLPDAPISFLLHGGHSSLVARGSHNGHRGWPVGIGNPLFTEKRLGTLLLCDQAMATSGSNIQFFRHEGRRYGHILDPRTGWPVDGMLSVTVIAPSAALADALSTAFFVMGVEKARLCCEKWPGVSAILLPFPDQGTKVRPTVVGIDPELIVWDETQVDPG